MFFKVPGPLSVYDARLYGHVLTIGGICDDGLHGPKLENLFHEISDLLQTTSIDLVRLSSVTAASEYNDKLLDAGITHERRTLPMLAFNLRYDIGSAFGIGRISYDNAVSVIR